MRVYIIIIAIFIFTSCEQERPKKQKSEPLKTVPFVEDTVAIKEQALKDCANGRFKLYAIGQLDDFARYYAEYLRTENGIEVEFTGCIILAEYEITNRIMKECIRAKFGKAFFEKSREKAYNRYMNQ